MIDTWYLIDSLFNDLTLELTIKWIFKIIYVYIVVIILVIILLYYITSNNNNHTQQTIVYTYNMAKVQSTVAHFIEAIIIIIFVYIYNQVPMLPIIITVLLLIQFN